MIFSYGLFVCLTLLFLISMENKSLPRELLEMFKFNPSSATVSALCQQREKILPEAFAFLFQYFNESFESHKTFHGYKLLACDGSDLNIARNPDDKDTHFPSADGGKGFNQLHLNAFYDLCDRRYTDALIQPGRKKNECRAMADMIDRCDSSAKTIFIADRAYEAYNLFAHAGQRNMYYLIRAKDIDSNGILSGLTLPQSDEFDVQIRIILTRKQTKQVKANPMLYKIMPNNSIFDYLDLDENPFYPMNFRVVRFALPTGDYECVITNLPEDEFPPDELKTLYNMRWGIETSFRELKYTIGLNCFHAKKVEYVIQEIWARLLLYNFCEIITTYVLIQKKTTKHVQQVNYTAAVLICRHFLWFDDISPPNVEILIRKNLLPVRPNRHDPRKVMSKSFVSFIYRIA